MQLDLLINKVHLLNFVIRFEHYMEADFQTHQFELNILNLILN